MKTPNALGFRRARFKRLKGQVDLTSHLLVEALWSPLTQNTRKKFFPKDSRKSHSDWLWMSSPNQCVLKDGMLWLVSLSQADPWAHAESLECQNSAQRTTNILQQRGPWVGRELLFLGRGCGVWKQSPRPGLGSASPEERMTLAKVHLPVPASCAASQAGTWTNSAFELFKPGDTKAQKRESVSWFLWSSLWWACP